MWFVANYGCPPEYALAELYDTDADVETIRAWCEWHERTFICAFKQLEAFDRNNRSENWKTITAEQMRADIAFEMSRERKRSNNLEDTLVHIDFAPSDFTMARRLRDISHGPIDTNGRVILPSDLDKLLK